MRPDAIIVLAGGIKRDVSGRWVSTGLTAEDDKLGAPGGKLRVLATAMVGNQYPTAVVVTSGGRGFDVQKSLPEERQLLAEILRDELMEAGVSSSRILLEEKSNTTYQALGELRMLIAERNWQNVMLVTSGYHLSRLRAMIEAKFPELNTVTKCVSAEEILLEANRAHWEPILTNAYNSVFMTERIAKEEQGIEQIKNGTYQFR